MESPVLTHPLNILLADDDKDDRFFFERALKALSVPTTLITVEDGEKLLDHLEKNSPPLSDVLFLDINMPRKNGIACLAEIKADPKLKDLPVIMYSTSLHNDLADELYEAGAHYFMGKREVTELIELLKHVFKKMIDSGFSRPTREEFVPELKRERTY